jgi:hypothetical protein
MLQVTGGLAVDCVKQGHPEFLAALVEAVGDIFIEREVASWVASQGGWVRKLRMSRSCRFAIQV